MISFDTIHMLLIIVCYRYFIVIHLLLIGNDMLTKIWFRNGKASLLVMLGVGEEKHHDLMV